MTLSDSEVPTMGVMKPCTLTSGWLQIWSEAFQLFENEKKYFLTRLSF